MTALACALSLLVAVPAWLERLYRKPEPTVAQALEKLRTGDAPQAVSLLEKAGAALHEPHQQGALAFDKSAALLMVGPQGAPLAADDAKKAMESPAAELHAPAAYNLGFALAEQGKKDEAIDAYGKSLTLDAGDQDAKYNLELLLRDDKKQQQGGQGKQDDKKQDQSKDDKQQDDKQQDSPKQAEQKQDQSAQQKDKGDQQKQRAQEQKDQEQQKKDQPKPQDQNQQNQDQQAQGQKKEQGKEREDDKKQQAQGRPVDRTQAQRLLDALRASEKNLQVWRFTPHKTRPPRQRNVDKDW